MFCLNTEGAWLWIRTMKWELRARAYGGSEMNDIRRGRLQIILALLEADEKLAEILKLYL